MLGSDSPHLSVDLDPSRLQAFDRAEQSDILMNGPLALFNPWIKVIKPFLSALMKGAIVFSFRLAKKLIGDQSPFVEASSFAEWWTKYTMIAVKSSSSGIDQTGQYFVFS